MRDGNWSFEFTGGLSASFFQPDGTSLPGTDWAVTLRNGDAMHRVMVRACLSNDLVRKLRND